jgi:hypothetical protein
MLRTESQGEEEREHEKEDQKDNTVSSDVPFQDGASNWKKEEAAGEGREANGILQTPNVKGKHDVYSSSRSRRVLLAQAQEQDRAEAEDTWLLVARPPLLTPATPPAPTNHCTLEDQRPMTLAFSPSRKSPPCKKRAIASASS